MSLFLPPKRRDPRHPILANARQFYPYSEIADHKATISDIVQELNAVPRDDAMRVLCALSKNLLSAHGMQPGFQLKSATDFFFPAEWIEKLRTRMQKDGADAGVVFHRRAVWFVLQLATIACRDLPQGMSLQDIAKRIGRSCFMANDVLSAIEAEAQEQVPRANVTDWMISALVTLFGCDHDHVDFDLIGRARLLWEEAPEAPAFRKKLVEMNLPSFDDAFAATYGLKLQEFLAFIVGLYVRFLGNQVEPILSPLLLDVADDEVGRTFGEDIYNKAMPLISQSVEELAVRLIGPRQSWALDVTPIRERPLLEIAKGKYCCPDLTLLVRTFIDRIYFLLEHAYGKGTYRALFGSLFECYVDRLMSEFAVASGKLRTYLRSPRFLGTHDQAADGILVWAKTAAIFEYKAGLLTTRQRMAGLQDALLDGIEALVNRTTNKGRKGVPQLAENIARMLSGNSRIVADGGEFDLSGYTRFYPILVCFDESIGFHAVTKRLQEDFEKELMKRSVDGGLVGPLMLLTIKDVEAMATAGQTVSIQNVLDEYANHLQCQPKDYSGSFRSFLGFKFGESIDWHKSLTFVKHNETLTKIGTRFESTGR